MKFGRKWKVGAVLLLLGSMLTTMAIPASAVVPGYIDGKMTLVDEPGGSSDYMEFYRDKQSLPLNELHWVENGVHGSAVSLDGVSEYLCVNYSQMQMPTLTFTAWVNWLGGETEEQSVGQRLFTMYRDEDNFLTVSLHQKVEDAGVMGDSPYGYDGIYMEYRLGGLDGVSRICGNPVFHGESYAIPYNEWHHYAVTISGQMLTLYVDGGVWFETELLLGAADMYAYEMQIGGSIWGDPYLHAYIDDAAMFSEALPAEQIALLAAGADLSFTAPTEGTTAYIPTEPSHTQTTTAPSKVSHENWVETITSIRMGLPLWTWILLGLYVLFFILATIFLNIRVHKEKKQGGEPQ